jgi:heme-degrading monooxygenase HmoA
MECGRRLSAVIARCWSAKATLEQAPTYVHHFKSAVVEELERIQGYQGGYLLQRETPNGVEIVVITLWDSLDSIRSFAGHDIDHAVVAEEAALLLSEFDRRVKQYEVTFSLRKAEA